MFVVALTLAAAATSPSAVCVDLAKQLDTTERSMASAYDFDQSWYEIELKTQNAKALSRNELRRAIARSVASGSRSAVVDGIKLDQEEAQERAELNQQRSKQQQSVDRYMAQGDRIVTLLASNGCAPPIRLLSWFSYSTKNPNADTTAPAASGRLSDAVNRVRRLKRH